MRGSTLLTALWRSLREWAGVFVRARRNDAVAYTEFEVRELENVFALLLLGSFVGLPSPPTFVAVELLADMGAELETLNLRAEQSSDMMAEMMGTLGID